MRRKIYLLVLLVFCNYHKIINTKFYNNIKKQSYNKYLTLIKNKKQNTIFQAIQVLYTINEFTKNKKTLKYLKTKLVISSNI